ncbi:molybdate ABC transporter substrate-binding protein [Aliiroseovarius sp. F20344]|uniref:molybdate ABC transporter substrate-binding protein n=1 Tax=Aliiroseovarius sp. F20344 TaxID=2926414 RepID=UPI001FF41D87|nr:molybdate ABC transporter substrate-binding protein [Aliiroseovarius sp. F20344]MCK0142074.1 molybdate ABC transporter substrate-binding protein [Aliiroseovarius sp. F20344]
MFLSTRRYTLRALFTALFLSASSLPSFADRITVFAAASLGGALDDVAAAFTKETGHETVLSYAGSSVLARQITLGAPADVFLSASTDWMDVVEDAGLLPKDSRRDFAGNRIVLVAPASTSSPAEIPASAEAFQSALEGGKLAMALVDSIPAGQYGKAALVALGLWKGVEPHLVQTDNVRAALALVALGEARLGIVYATDALAEPKVRKVATLPSSTHAPITYPGAVMVNGDVKTATTFLEFLLAPTAQDILTDHGFLPAAKVVR